MQRISKILLTMLFALQPIAGFAQEHSKSILKWSSSAQGHGLLRGYVEDVAPVDRESTNSSYFRSVKILEEKSEVFGGEGDYIHLITVAVGNDDGKKTKIMMKFPSTTKEFTGDVDLVRAGEWQLVDQGKSDFDGMGYGSVTAFVPAGSGRFMYELTDMSATKLKASLE